MQLMQTAKTFYVLHAIAVARCIAHGNGNKTGHENSNTKCCLKICAFVDSMLCFAALSHAILGTHNMVLKAGLLFSTAHLLL